VSEAAAVPADPGALIRSRSYRVLLVFAALIGVLVSFASWCFLELVHWIQTEVYQSLPSGLGLHPVLLENRIRLMTCGSSGIRRRARIR